MSAKSLGLSTLLAFVKVPIATKEQCAAVVWPETLRADAGSIARDAISEPAGGAVKQMEREAVERPSASSPRTSQPAPT